MKMSYENNGEADIIARLMDSAMNGNQIALQTVAAIKGAYISPPKRATNKTYLEYLDRQFAAISRAVRAERE